MTTFPYRIAVGLTAIFLTLVVRERPILRQFERNLYDARSVSYAKGVEPDDRIVLIVIDEETLDRLEPAVGSWPWPRGLHAAVVDFCSQAKVVAMDILFAEEA